LINLITILSLVNYVIREHKTNSIHTDTGSTEKLHKNKQMNINAKKYSYMDVHRYISNTHVMLAACIDVLNTHLKTKECTHRRETI